jgi:hypothetical protein
MLPSPLCRLSPALSLRTRRARWSGCGGSRRSRPHAGALPFLCWSLIGYGPPWPAQRLRGRPADAAGLAFPTIALCHAIALLDAPRSPGSFSQRNAEKPLSVATMSLLLAAREAYSQRRVRRAEARRQACHPSAGGTSSSGHDSDVAELPRKRGVPPDAHSLPIAAVDPRLAVVDIRLSQTPQLLRRLHGALLRPLRLRLRAAARRPHTAVGCPGAASRGPASTYSRFALDGRVGWRDWHCKERPWWEHGCGRKATDLMVTGLHNLPA